MEQKSTQPQISLLKTETRVLLISNSIDWNPLHWLSLLIRIFTYGPNHAALLEHGLVKEMVGSGYKETPLEEWLPMTRREVKVYRPLVELQQVDISGGYGFLDLVQFFLHIVRKKWLLRGNDWNGRDGVRLMPGVFCSEYIGLLLGREDAHLLAPADLQHVPELELELEFVTSATGVQVVFCRAGAAAV